MARLSNDCFAAGDGPMRLDEALGEIGRRVVCVADREPVPLLAAAGRILARDVRAGIALPPFANAAVDGYAVRFADLVPGRDTLLPVGGRIAAGDGAGAAASVPGVAIQIFTGAAIPDGLDTVFMQEDVTVEPDGRVRLPSGLRRGDNRRLAGEDLAAGAPALAAGRRLSPADLALLGALGLGEVTVHARLRVAVFSTGNELADPGRALRPGELHDANRPMLIGLLGRLGCVVTDLGTLPDRRDALAQALARAAEAHDLLLTSGGVSTGEEDHVRDAVASVGRLSFWRVALKPGRPVALGTVGACAFAGLPGNPVAAFVAFAALVRPLLARLGGEHYRPPLPLPVPADFAYRKREGRREYLRVSLAEDGGRIFARKHPREGAGMITSLTETDGFAVLSEDLTEVAPGDPLPYLPYRSFE